MLQLHLYFLCPTARRIYSQLIQESLRFPGTSPVLHAAVETAFILVGLDQVVQAPVATAEDNVLSKERKVSRVSSGIEMAIRTSAGGEQGRSRSSRHRRR